MKEDERSPESITATAIKNANSALPHNRIKFSIQGLKHGKPIKVNPSCTVRKNLRRFLMKFLQKAIAQYRVHRYEFYLENHSQWNGGTTPSN